MLHISRCPISADETSASLYTKLAELGPSALVNTINKLAKGEITPESQNDNDAKYAKKLSKDEANIDWSMTASQIERNIRAFNPWPACFTQMGGQTVKIYQARVVDQSGNPGQILLSDKNGVIVACGEHALCITQLQPQGKKPMAINDFLNGRSDWVTPGNVLGENNE
jgi:methionyl-tRNA formyltransferase